MIVYGELERTESARDVLLAVESTLSRLDSLPAGIERHASLVGAFIRTAEFVHGIADREVERRGCDHRSPAQDAGAVLLLEMAKAMNDSWKSGFGDPIVTGELLGLVRRADAEGVIRTRTGEGYAHYALYPEAYLEAARRSRLGADTVVVGIRSIGVGLAALVSAELGAPAAISLRPIGHPFDRRIKAAPDLLAADAAKSSVDFAIVDEGPGLSGSSFAGVARWLCEQGIPLDRIHFFPSHSGEPGAHATAETRAMWAGARRHPASSESVIFHRNGLARWAEETIGSLALALEALPGAPQPTDGRFTRRKFLARNADGCWLVKFGGVGQTGERKFRDAVSLAKAGFAPTPVGLCHGFIVQEWVPGRALDETAYDRRAVLSALASYLAFRATQLSLAGAGSSLEELRRMAVYNTGQALGSDAAANVERRLCKLAPWEHRIKRVRTDNRLHSWKWLVTGTGFLKLDAIDHCEGHDLIGCQDIAWDVAGSIVEYELTDEEFARLTGMLCATPGVQLDRELVVLLLPCYLAFQLGLWSTASPSTLETAALSKRYSERLSDLLARDREMDA